MFRAGNENSFEEAEKRKRKRRFPSRVMPIVIAVFVVLLHLNSLENQFTNWDDGMIYQNPTIRNLDWNGIKKLFTFERGNTYQPVRALSYAVDYKFWRLNPIGYHITNILFYVLTSLVVFFTLEQLSTSLRKHLPPDSHRRVALFGSLLFVAHPVHVEAVTWLAARKEVLQGFFLFLAFYLYLKGREEEGGKRVILLGVVLISFLLAILSKPSAVVFPAVILVYEVTLRQKKWIDFVKQHLSFLVVSVLMSLIFAWVLFKVMLDAGGIKFFHGGTFFTNLLTTFYVFLYNIKLLTFTVNYSAAYTLPIPNTILDLRTLTYIGITISFFCLALWSLKWTKVFFFALLFFFITILPYLNLIPISTLLADRYVFIASFSYCFLLGIGFDKFYYLRNKHFSEGFFKLLAATLFLFVIAGYSLMTIQQNRIWENSYTLWADAVEKYPDSNTANSLMGVVYMDLGIDEKAVEYLEKAVRLLPYDYISRNNLGIIYGRSGQPERALRELTTAIWLRPEDDSIRINLSVHHLRQKEYGKAEEVIRYLLSKNNHNANHGANLHFRLGLIYTEAGKYDAAISELQKAAELAPSIITPYEELGNLYSSRLEDAQKAKFYYTKGIEMAPKAKSKAEELRWMIQDLERNQ